MRRGGAVLAEHHDEWADGRRDRGRDILARAQARDTTPTTAEVTQHAIQAITAEPTTAQDHVSYTTSPDLTPRRPAGNSAARE